MADEMSDERIAEIEERCKAATRGPWRWNLNLTSRSIILESVQSGFEVVMDFARWGMNGARPRFRTPECFMEDAEKYGVLVEGRSHHSDWFRGLSHPDADFIQESREDVPDLCAALREAREREEELRKMVLDAHRAGRTVRDLGTLEFEDDLDA